MTQTLELKVTGGARINCVGCEQRIDTVLRRLPGVEEVRASAQLQQVSVRFDPDQVQPEQVQAKLAQLGYEAVEDAQ
jgi:copper chaperone CopZ